MASLFADSIQILAPLWEIGIALQRLAIEGDDGHDIVEVVGDAGRELADRCQPFLSLEVLLSFVLLGDVVQREDGTARLWPGNNGAAQDFEDQLLVGKLEFTADGFLRRHKGFQGPVPESRQHVADAGPGHQRQKVARGRVGEHDAVIAIEDEHTVRHGVNNLLHFAGVFQGALVKAGAPNGVGRHVTHSAQQANVGGGEGFGADQPDGAGKVLVNAQRKAGSGIVTGHVVARNDAEFWLLRKVGRDEWLTSLENAGREISSGNQVGAFEPMMAADDGRHMPPATPRFTEKNAGAFKMEEVVQTVQHGVEHFVALPRGAQGRRHLFQSFQFLGPAVGLLVELGILQGDGYLGGHGLQQTNVLFTESVRPERLNGHGAQRLLAAEEGDAQPGDGGAGSVFRRFR